jgi:hypothetical protein
MSTLNSRVSSSTSSLHRTTTRLYSTTNRLARKRSRVSLLAVGAATAGLLGGAAAIADAAPWDQAMGNVASTAHGGSLPSSGHSGTSALDAFGGAVHASQPARQQAIGGHGSHTQSAAVRGSSTAKSAAAPNKAATPAKAVPAKAAPAKAATTAHVARAARHQAPRRAANPGPSKPYLVYDSVTPNTIPSGQPAAVYADGAYAASTSQVAGHHSVLWIDCNGSDPSANVLDVEPGDATPAGAAQWVGTRLHHQPNSVAIVYTMLSDWQSVKDNVGGLPSWMQSHVRYWIADPTGSPHMIPGSSATQWYWGSNYDISTANPNFEH